MNEKGPLHADIRQIQFARANALAGYKANKLNDISAVGAQGFGSIAILLLIASGG